MSFEYERKTCPPLERPSCSFHPTISFETPMESMENSSGLIDAAAEALGMKILIVVIWVSFYLLTVSPNKPKLSRSFEQPSKLRPKPDRMANSLDVTAYNFDARRCSIPEEDRVEDEKPVEDRAEPVYISLDELRITAPLLEGLKSSDVW